MEERGDLGVTERCSKCGSPLDNEGSCFTHGKEQTEPEGYKVKTGKDADGYSAYALVWPGSEEVEHLPEENQTPLYAPDTIHGGIKEELWLLAEELDLDTSDVDKIEERLKTKFSGDKAGQTEGGNAE